MAELNIVANTRECPGCGLFHRLPDLAPGRVARCLRCRGRLDSNNARAPHFASLALTITSVVFYGLSILQPLMTFDIYGRSRTISLLTGPLELINEGWAPVGILVMLATVVFPAIVIALMLVVSTSVAFGRVTVGTARLLRWHNKLRPWSMAEVYILGVFVAYSKLIDLAEIDVGFAVYAIVGLMITMACTDATIRSDIVWVKRHQVPSHQGPPATCQMAEFDVTATLPPPWRMVGCPECGLVCSTPDPAPEQAYLGRCPRCSQPLRRRKPDSLRRTAALLLAATVFYIPANLFPIMTIIQLYRGGGHTIVGGVIELYVAGMLPLALLVFFASITVPVLKILSLGVMVLGTWQRSAVRLVDRSRLYHMVVFIGRWSMIDVFMVSILVGLVQFRALGHVNANAGIEAFAAVVVLTIFAADAFDPRIMWDAVGLNGFPAPAGSAEPAHAAVAKA